MVFGFRWREFHIMAHLIFSNGIEVVAMLVVLLTIDDLHPTVGNVQFQHKFLILEVMRNTSAPTILPTSVEARHQCAVGLSVGEASAFIYGVAFAWKTHWPRFDIIVPV
jgi:hypothetical protein